MQSASDPGTAVFRLPAQEKARFLHAVFDASGRGLGTGSEVAPLKQIRSYCLAIEVGSEPRSIPSVL